MNQAWRLYTNPNTLWVQVLKAKYFPQATVFTGPRSSRRSYVWTAFMLGANLLFQGMRWIIGDGQTIRLWKDPWLPQGSLGNYIEGPLLPHDKDCKVSLLHPTHSWSFDSLNLPIPHHLQNIIRGIPVARFTRLEDVLLWPHNKGTCSAKSASKFLYQQQHVPWDKSLWNWIWSLPCPKKNPNLHLESYAQPVTH